MKVFQVIFAVLFSVGSAQASTLDFNFEITNSGVTLTGTIYGLSDNAASSATEVVLNSAPLEPGTQSFVNCLTCFVFGNSFTVSSGLIVAATFESVIFTQPFPFAKLLLIDAEGVFFGRTSPTFWGVSSYAPGQVTPVPLPLGSVLLLTALAGGVGIGRRRRKASQINAGNFSSAGAI